jgi:hypothetical protein
MDSAPSKMSRLIEEIVCDDDAQLESTVLLEEMEAQWEQDWAEL